MLNPERPKTVELMGVAFDALTPQGLIDYLLAESQSHRGGSVLTPNLDGLRSAVRNAQVREVVLKAKLRVADGMPLVWASRLQGSPLPDRVAGSDLIYTLSRALAPAGRTVFLLGGNPGTAEQAGQILRDDAPGLKVVGTYCPPVGFDSNPAALEHTFRIVETAGADFVYIGLPFFKAGALATRMSETMPATWFLGLGVSFSFVCGEVSRAPVWMQRSGLEWSHRLVQEPGRLMRRYVVECLPFGLSLMFDALLTRVSPRRRVNPNDTLHQSAEANDRRPLSRISGTTPQKDDC